MTDFAVALAEDVDPAAIATRCAEQLRSAREHTLGFVYATSPLADRFGAIVAALRERTGIVDWVGTVGYGICAQEREIFERPAVVVMTARFAADAYRLIPPVATLEGVAAALAPNFAAAIGVLHGDPRHPATIPIVAGLAKASGAFMVGGLSAADGIYPQVAGSDIGDSRVSGVLLGGRMQLAVGLTQGCSPVGPVHEVGRSEGQIISTLDGRRAYDILCEDVGIAEGADPRPWLRDVHAALPVPGSDQADYVVRNLIGIDPRKGLVAVAEAMAKGDRLMFVRRDGESAAKDLGRMIEELKGRVTGRPKAGLYFSCVARGPNMFAKASHEMLAIRKAFGDFPIAGFFGNGEISNDRVYGYTGVLTLFS